MISKYAQKKKLCQLRENEKKVFSPHMAKMNVLCACVGDPYYWVVTN